MEWSFHFLLMLINFGFVTNIQLQLFNFKTVENDTTGDIKELTTPPKPEVTCRIIHFPDGTIQQKICDNSSQLLATTISTVRNIHTENYSDLSLSPTDVMSTIDPANKTNFHSENVTKSKPFIAKNVSEIEDLTHQIYKGGYDVDEVGVGNRKEFKSREEQKMGERQLSDGNENIKSTIVLSSTSPLPQNLSSGVSSNVKSTIAAIVVGLSATLGVFATAAILIWRKILAKRYENREELINDDFSENNDADMHHFEFKLLSRI